MTKKILFWLVIIVAVGAPAYYFINKYLTSEKQRVRNVLDGIASSVETSNVLLSMRGVSVRLSESYRHSEDGQSVDKAFAMQFLTGLKQQYADLKVELKVSGITVLADVAHATIAVRVTGAPRGSPEKRADALAPLGLCRVKVYLEKQDGDWLVTGSERLQGGFDDAPGE